MVTYGDGVANIDIRKLADFHYNKDTIGTITGAHPSSRFGLIEKLTTKQKKLRFPPGHRSFHDPRCRQY